jgi:hypothetical protein
MTEVTKLPPIHRDPFMEPPPPEGSGIPSYWAREDDPIAMETHHRLVRKAEAILNSHFKSDNPMARSWHQNAATKPP